MSSGTHKGFTPGTADLRKAGLCFIDVETTGSIFGYHEIVDVGVVKTLAGGKQVVKKWHRRVRPMHPDRITPQAARLNGYDPKLWESTSVSSTEVWKEFNHLTSGCVAVCHNPSFDRPFISIAARQSGVDELELDYHWIGTESLAWPLYIRGLVGGLSLGKLSTHFGLPKEPLPHTAIHGAMACLEIYKRLVLLR
jgi:DNA polymerase III alpha subunit (gram-positive type)